MSIPAQAVGALRTFVEGLKADPSTIHAPELAFFREYIESLGGTVPAKPEPAPAPEPEPSCCSNGKCSGGASAEQPACDMPEEDDEAFDSPPEIEEEPFSIP